MMIMIMIVAAAALLQLSVAREQEVPHHLRDASKKREHPSYMSLTDASTKTGTTHFALGRNVYRDQITKFMFMI